MHQLSYAVIAAGLNWSGVTFTDTSTIIVLQQGSVTFIDTSSNLKELIWVVDLEILIRPGIERLVLFPETFSLFKGITEKLPISPH